VLSRFSALGVVMSQYRTVLLSDAYGKWYTVPEDLVLMFESMDSAITAEKIGGEKWTNAIYEFYQIFDGYEIDSPKGLVVTGEVFANSN